MRILIGALIWIALLVGGGVYLADFNTERAESNSQLVQYLTSSRRSYELSFDQQSVVKIGDPVILVVDDGPAQIVGYVINNSQENVEDPRLPRWTDWAKVELFSSAPEIAEMDYLSYHTTPASMDWVVQMMLPPYKRQEIGQLIMNAYSENQDEIAQVLQPVVLRSVREAAEVVKEEFYASIARHEQQISDLGNRYQVELVEEELVPLIKDEIWPIVQEESAPVASAIGQRMWKQASLWRFGWRMLYDQSPLPEKNLVKKEFERFMSKHGSPIIESYLPEIMLVQQEVMRRASENEEVQTVVSEASMQVLRDPEFQKLTTDILRDVFVDNDRLIQVFEKNWSSKEAQDALQLTNARLDPTITEIGQALFGSAEKSITPEFSRVLRNRILHKDQQWLALHMTKNRNQPVNRNAILKVVNGETGTENPFHVPTRSKF